jgi:hypothetical protein
MTNLMRSPTRRALSARALIAEGPGAEFHARRDLDDLVRGVEADRLYRRGIERLQLRARAQRLAFGEGAFVTLAADFWPAPGLRSIFDRVVGVAARGSQQDKQNGG